MGLAQDNWKLPKLLKFKSKCLALAVTRGWLGWRQVWDEKLEDVPLDDFLRAFHHWSAGRRHSRKESFM